MVLLSTLRIVSTWANRYFSGLTSFSSGYILQKYIWWMHDSEEYCIQSTRSYIYAIGLTKIFWFCKTIWDQLGWITSMWYVITILLLTILLLTILISQDSVLSYWRFMFCLKPRSLRPDQENQQQLSSLKWQFVTSILITRQSFRVIILQITRQSFRVIILQRKLVHFSFLLSWTIHAENNLGFIFTPIKQPNLLLWMKLKTHTDCKASLVWQKMSAHVCL